MDNGAWNGPMGIERGKITSVTDEGYIVESMDRPGLITPPIISIFNTPYIANDAVYFFLFPDGTGRVLFKI